MSRKKLSPAALARMQAHDRRRKNERYHGDPEYREWTKKCARENYYKNKEKRMAQMKTWRTENKHILNVSENRLQKSNERPPENATADGWQKKELETTTEVLGNTDAN